MSKADDTPKHLEALRKLMVEQGIRFDKMRASHAELDAQWKAVTLLTKSNEASNSDMLKTLKAFAETKREIEGATGQAKILSARIEAVSTQIAELRKDAAGMADISAVKQLIDKMGKDVYKSIRDVVARVDALEAAAKKK